MAKIPTGSGTDIALFGAQLVTGSIAAVQQARASGQQAVAQAQALGRDIVESAKVREAQARMRQVSREFNMRVNLEQRDQVISSIAAQKSDALNNLRSELAESEALLASAGVEGRTAERVQESISATGKEMIQRIDRNRDRALQSLRNQLEAHFISTEEYYTPTEDFDIRGQAILENMRAAQFEAGLNGLTNAISSGFQFVDAIESRKQLETINAKIKSWSKGTASTESTGAIKNANELSDAESVRAPNANLGGTNMFLDYMASLYRRR